MSGVHWSLTLRWIEWFGWVMTSRSQHCRKLCDWASRQRGHRRCKRALIIIDNPAISCFVFLVALLWHECLMGHSSVAMIAQKFAITLFMLSIRQVGFCRLYASIAFRRQHTPCVPQNGVTLRQMPFKLTTFVHEKTREHSIVESKLEHWFVLYEMRSSDANETFNVWIIVFVSM